MEFKREAEEVFARSTCAYYESEKIRMVADIEKLANDAYEKGLRDSCEIIDNYSDIDCDLRIKNEILALKRPAGENSKGYCKEQDCEGH